MQRNFCTTASVGPINLRTEGETEWVSTFPGLEVHSPCRALSKPDESPDRGFVVRSDHNPSAGPFDDPHASARRDKRPIGRDIDALVAEARPAAGTQRRIGDA